MPAESPSLFAEVIQEHLELKRRNAALEPEMPLEKYKTDDPFENHPLFKTEEQARRRGHDRRCAVDRRRADVARLAGRRHVHRPSVEARRGRRGRAARDQTDESLWSSSRDFDWGD